MYFLAVDIGASGGRCILGWVENGAIKLEEVHRFVNEIINKNGVLCWDTDALFSEIITGMKKCAEIGKIPESVGIDTWGVDYVLFDGKNNILGDAVSYRDSRTENIDAKAPISDTELYTRTGIQKMPINTIYQLMSDNLSGAKKLLMLPDYFHYRLCGVAKTEYTIATTSGLVSANARDWDDEIIEKCGFPRDIFCEIVPPGTSLGELLPEIQKIVGYNCRVVLPAAHDTASAVVTVPDDTLFISSGTWSLMGIERDAPDCSEQSRSKNFTNEGGYNFRYRYLKNIMGLWLLQCVKKELGDFSFQELSDMAESANIEAAINANDSRLFAPKSMTRAIQTLCAEAGCPTPKTPAELAAVIYNSLAKSYAQTASELEQITGRTFDKICIVGGGSKAKYLNKLTEEYCKKSIITASLLTEALFTEATAVGNLIAQMITAKIFPSLTAARNCIKNCILNKSSIY